MVRDDVVVMPHAAAVVGVLVLVHLLPLVVHQRVGIVSGSSHRYRPAYSLVCTYDGGATT